MEEKGKTGTGVEDEGMIDTWLRKHRLIYVGATRHPLILSIRDGTVDISAFKTWLVMFSTLSLGILQTWVSFKFAYFYWYFNCSWYSSTLKHLFKKKKKKSTLKPLLQEASSEQVQAFSSVKVLMGPS